MKCRFRHVTATLYYPESNRLGENSVKIIKPLLKKPAESHSDPNLPQLHYKMAPMKHRVPPADVCFSRKLKTRNVRVTGDLHMYKETDQAEQNKKSV